MAVNLAKATDNALTYRNHPQIVRARMARILPATRMGSAEALIRMALRDNNANVLFDTFGHRDSQDIVGGLF